MISLRGLLGPAAVVAFLVAVWGFLPSLREDARQNSYAEFRAIGEEIERVETGFFRDGPRVVNIANPLEWFGDRLPEAAFIGIFRDIYVEPGLEPGQAMLWYKATWSQRELAVREEFVVAQCHSLEIKKFPVASVPGFDDPTLADSHFDRAASEIARTMEWVRMNPSDENMFCQSGGREPAHPDGDRRQPA